MNVIERVASWLGLETGQARANQTLESLQVILERTRRFKRSGRYDEALDEIARALDLADQIQNETLPVAIQLHKADILTRKGAFQEAEQLLDQLESEAQADDEGRRAQMVYVILGQGVLAQERGDMEIARGHYEVAQQMARESQTLGAQGRAQGHLGDVYLVEGNASYAAYLLEDALEKLNTSGDVEMSSYFAGRLGQALILNGKKQAGQQLLGRALRLAERMEYREVELLWRQVLAVEAMEAGLYEEARRHLMLVLAHLSAGGSGKELDHVLTLCRLSKVCLRLGEDDAALDYGRQAVELVESEADDDSKGRRLLAHAALGVALRSDNQPQAALNHLRMVEMEYRHVDITAGEHSYIDVLRNLAAALTETRNYERAKEVYDQATAYAETQAAPADLAGTHRDLGIYYARQGAFTDAVQSWMTALRIYETENDHARVARIYCDIANVRRQFGQAKRAMKDYEQALMLLSSIDDLETRGLVLSNAATAYVDHGDVNTAEAFFVEAIQIAQRLQDRPSEAMRRGNYGWFLVMTGRPKMALEALDYAVRQSENLGLQLQVAVQTDNIGLAYDALGELEKALAHHARAWEMLKAGGDDYWKTMVSANLGVTLTRLQRWEDARQVLEAALEAARQLGRSDLLARVLTSRALLALEENDLELAGSLIEEAAANADGSGSRRTLADAMIIRSDWHMRHDMQQQAEADWSIARELLQLLGIAPAEYEPAWLKNR
ncbi:MAG: tetratricopeptide repeat protein [Chloroflexota bacterium]